MSKKLFALVLAVLLSLFCLNACKKADNTTTASGNVQTQDSGAQGSETSQTAQENKQGGKSDENAGNGGASESTAQASSKAGSEKTDGWKQQEDGLVVKGNVKVNVAKYGDASLADGEELIKQLIEGGLKNTKVISKETTDKAVVYKVSGVRIGSEKSEFVKFEYLRKNGTGYLITLIAEDKSGLESDLSYVHSHLSELAQ